MAQAACGKMHELSMTQSILGIVLEKAQAVQATKITRIDLVIGELSGIIDECVRSCFELVSQGTIAAGATLCFSRPVTKLRCCQCGITFSPDGDWSCPACRGLRTEIISGRECFVNSMEVD